MSLADGVTLLPALVKKFHDLHPEALVHLDAGYEPELMEKLEERQAGLRPAGEPAASKTSISRETLGYKRLMFCAPGQPALQLARPSR